jgi:hypothetical protein
MKNSLKKSSEDVISQEFAVHPMDDNSACTLDLTEAAKLLKIHPVTLQIRAKAGKIPGCKIGRSWVFIRFDLLHYIRSQYATRVAQGDTKEISKCHSINAKIHPSSGSKSRLADEQYKKVLGLTTS